MFAGMVGFPFGKTLLEVLQGESSDKGFGQRLLANYADPANWLRGALIGFGLRYGLTPGKGPLRGVLGRESNKGMLLAEGDAQTAIKYARYSQPLSNEGSRLLGAKKFLYGGIVGVSAGTGVNLIRGDYSGEENWKTKVIADTVGSFILGGSTAAYLGMQGRGILSGFDQYSSTAKLQPANIAGFIDLGKANGAKLLYNRALAGAVEWIGVSPAFTAGGSLWEGLKLKGGYYKSELSELYDENGNLRQDLDLDEDTRAALIAIQNVTRDPRTWGALFVQKGYKAKVEVDKEGNVTVKEEPRISFATLKGGDLLQSAIQGPRSGLWMKPMIELLQVRAGRPTVMNQGGIFERFIINPIKKLRYGKDFEAKSIETAYNRSIPATTLGAKVAKGTLGALRWADTTMISMPAVVTTIDTAIDFIDKRVYEKLGGGVDKKLVESTGQTLLFTLDPNSIPKDEDGKRFKEGTHLASFKRRGGYIPSAVASYATWLYFFMFPSYSPSGDDMFLARKYIGDDGKFTPQSFAAFKEAQGTARRYGGLEQAMRADAKLRSEISQMFDPLKISYLKEQGLTDEEARWVVDQYERGNIQNVKEFLSNKGVVADLEKGGLRQNLNKFLRQQEEIAEIRRRLSGGNLSDAQKKALENRLSTLIKKGVVRWPDLYSSNSKPYNYKERTLQETAFSKDIVLGLDYLRDFFVTGDRDHLQWFIANSLWLSEGKPEGKLDVHWALAGKILDGKININHNFSQNKELMWQRDVVELEYLRGLKQRTPEQQSRLKQLELEEKIAATLNNYQKAGKLNLPGSILKTVDSLKLEDIQESIKSKKEIEPLRIAVESGISEGAFTLSTPEQEKILRAKDKDIVTVVVKSPTGEEFPVEILINRDLQLRVAIQFIEPYRAKGDILNGLVELEKYNKGLSDPLFDWVADRDKSLSESRAVISGNTNISFRQKAYHEKNVAYWDAYFKGASQNELANFAKARSEALKEANLEILNQNLKSINENGLARLSQERLFRRAIENGLVDHLLTADAIRSSVRIVLTDALSRLSLKELDRLVKDAQNSHKKAHEIVCTVRIGKDVVALTKQNVQDLYLELRILRNDIGDKGLFDSKVDSRIITQYLFGSDRTRRNIGKHVDRLSPLMQKIIKFSSESGMFDSDGKVDSRFIDMIKDSNGDIDAVKATALIMVAGKEFIKRSLGDKFTPEKSNDGFKMMVDFINEINVSLEAGGGKTPIYPLEMLIRALSQAKYKDGKFNYKLNQMLVVRPNEVDQTVRDTKDTRLKIGEFLEMFGIEKINGNDFYLRNDIEGLKKVLSDPSKIVVFDHDIFGHLRNVQDRELQDILVNQDVIRFDEFHLPFASSTTYLLGEGKMRVDPNAIKAAGLTYKIIQDLCDKGIIKIEKESLDKARESSQPTIYINAKKWALNDAAIELLRREIPTSEKISVDRLIGAYLDAKVADNYEVYNQTILPKDRGTLQPDRVFSDPYFLSALFAQEKAKGSDVSAEKLEITDSAYQATLAEVLRFKPGASILGASGTLSEVKILEMLHLGRGTDIISETKFNVNEVNSAKNISTDTLQLKGATVIFAKDEGLLDNLYKTFAGVEKTITLSAEGNTQEFRVRESNNKIILRIQADTPESQIVIISKNIAQKYDNKDIIVLSNQKGATGINYEGKFDLVVLDAHNWGKGDLLQVISRNRRGNVKEGDRKVFYDKEALVKLTPKAKNQLAAEVKQEVSEMNKKLPSGIKDNSEVLDILENAAILDRIETSDALLHHTREAAFSRSVIESLKDMMRFTSSDADRRFLDELMKDAIDKKGEVNLRIAQYHKTGEERLEEILKGIASISYEVFDKVSRRESLPIILRHRASFIG